MGMRGISEGFERFWTFPFATVYAVLPTLDACISDRGPWAGLRTHQGIKWFIKHISPKKRFLLWAPENEWRETKETKDRKQFNSKAERKPNASRTKEGQCAPVPAERPKKYGFGTWVQFGYSRYFIVQFTILAVFLKLVLCWCVIESPCCSWFLYKSRENLKGLCLTKRKKANHD